VASLHRRLDKMTRLLVSLLLAGGLGGCALVPRNLEPIEVCDNAVYPHLNNYPNDLNVCTPVKVWRVPWDDR